MRSGPRSCVRARRSVRTQRLSGARGTCVATLTSMAISRLFLGRILANRKQEERNLTAVEGVPAMGLDGLGSSAYGPEAALAVLIPLGAAGLAYIGPIIA